MNVLREKIVYTDAPVHICMKELTRLEQYECVRMLLAHPSARITVCPHGATNTYIDGLLETLRISLRSCQA
jgi:hypothetical protein